MEYAENISEHEIEFTAIISSIRLEYCNFFRV